jgi:hypothetical protein
MRRPGVAATTPLSALLLFGGLSLGTLVSCTSVEALAEGAGQLEQGRLGFGVDPTGRVSAGLAASSFSLSDPIHLSVVVTGATTGTLVNVSVRDVVTQQVAWREERPVPSGSSYQTFYLGREIAQGSYRAELTLGGAPARPLPFVVHARLRSSL